MCLTRDCGLLSPLGGIDSCRLHALVALCISNLLNRCKTRKLYCQDWLYRKLPAHHPPGKNNLRLRPKPAIELMASSHTRKGYSIVNSTASLSRNTSQQQQQSAGNGCFNVFEHLSSLHCSCSYILSIIATAVGSVDPLANQRL